MQKTFIIILILLPITIWAVSHASAHPVEKIYSNKQPAGCMMCHQPSSPITIVPDNKKP